MPGTPETTKLIDCPLFHHMTETELRDVFELVERECYGKGERILVEGRSTQILWVIVEGQCEVVKERKGGGEQQLAILEPKAIFGEMSFFNPAPHSASIRTLTEVEVMRLSRENFDGLQKRGASAAYRLAFNTVAVLSERVRKMDDWMCDFIEQPGASQHLEEWRDFRSKLYSDWQF